MKNFLSRIYHKIVKIYVSHSSSNHRIKYLRSLGARIGNDCRIYSIDFSSEPFLITIGNHTAVGYDVKFITHDAGVICFKPGLTGGIFGKIVIGDNVFIGNHTIVLPNTTIGNNCIIGAGSVVRGNIPDNSVVMGNPAKVVGSMNVLKYFYKNSPGLIQTDGLSTSEKDKLVKQTLCKE